MRETREKTIHEDSHKSSNDWEIPLFLPKIDSREGYMQRWVRMKIHGEDDYSFSRMMTMGWRPRPADTLPKDVYAPKTNIGEYGNVIATHDSILMEIPRQNFERYATYIDKKNKELEDSISNLNSGLSKGRGFSDIEFMKNTRRTTFNKPR